MAVHSQAINFIIDNIGIQPTYIAAGLCLSFTLLRIIGWALIFRKVGIPSWRAFVPLLNSYHIARLAGREYSLGLLSFWRPADWFTMQMSILEGFGGETQGNYWAIYFMLWFYLIKAGLSDAPFTPISERHNAVLEQAQRHRDNAFTEL